MARRKTNVKQVIASIRRDLIERGYAVPKECRVIWFNGERKLWINVKTRQVWGSLEGRVMLEGKI